MRGLATVALLALWCLSGCTSASGVFRCNSPTACGDGTCEETGFCSFVDVGCASGRRYGAAASDELASTCVDEGAPGVDGLAADGGAGPDGSTGPDGSPDAPPVPIPDARPRITRGLVALYTFSSVTGGIARDTSGFDTPLDLVVPASVGRSGGALLFDEEAGASSSVGATKVVTACKASDEATIEAWLQRSSGSGDLRVITGLMQGLQPTDIELWQQSDAYKAELRSDATTGGASATLSTPIGAVAGSMTHLVATRTAAGDRVVYVDGAAVAALSQPGTLDPWVDDRLWVGNDPAGASGYRGTIELVAYYCTALTDAEVQANLAAGPDYGD